MTGKYNSQEATRRSPTTMAGLDPAADYRIKIGQRLRSCSRSAAGSGMVGKGMARRYGREAARGSPARLHVGGHVHAGLPSVQSSGGLMPGKGNYSPNESQEEGPAGVGLETWGSRHLDQDARPG